MPLLTCFSHVEPGIFFAIERCQKATVWKLEQECPHKSLIGKLGKWEGCFSGLPMLCFVFILASAAKN